VLGTEGGMVREGVQGGKVQKNETGTQIAYQGRTRKDRLPVQQRLMIPLMQSWEGRTNMIAGKEVTIVIRLASVLFVQLQVILG
jgi:hypothetical protein